MGKPEEALVKHQEGLEIKLKLLDSEHPDVRTGLFVVKLAELFLQHGSERGEERWPLRECR